MSERIHYQRVKFSVAPSALDFFLYTMQPAWLEGSDWSTDNQLAALSLPCWCVAGTYTQAHRHRVTLASVMQRLARPWPIVDIFVGFNATITIGTITATNNGRIALSLSQLAMIVWWKRFRHDDYRQHCLWPCQLPVVMATWMPCVFEFSQFWTCITGFVKNCEAQ